MGGRQWPQVQSQSEHPLGTVGRAPGGWEPPSSPCRLAQPLPSRSAIVSLSHRLAQQSAVSLSHCLAQPSSRSAVCRLAQPSSRSAIVFHLSKLFASGPEVPGKLSSCGAHWVSQGPSQGLHRPCSKSSIFAESLQRREPPFRCRNKSWSHK